MSMGRAGENFTWGGKGGPWSPCTLGGGGRGKGLQGPQAYFFFFFDEAAIVLQHYNIVSGSKYTLRTYYSFFPC